MTFFYIIVFDIQCAMWLMTCLFLSAGSGRLHSLEKATVKGLFSTDSHRLRLYCDFYLWYWHIYSQAMMRSSPFAFWLVLIGHDWTLETALLLQVLKSPRLNFHSCCFSLVVFSPSKQLFAKCLQRGQSASCLHQQAHDQWTSPCFQVC